MRVIVTGSRNWDDPQAVWAALDYTYERHPMAPDEEFIVVHGDCPSGADRHAKEWCAHAAKNGRSVTEEPHPANWELYGKYAGFKRNRKMAELGAQLCLAFIRDGSRGTRHMAGQSESRGIRTARFRWGGGRVGPE